MLWMKFCYMFFDVSLFSDYFGVSPLASVSMVFSRKHHINLIVKFLDDIYEGLDMPVPRRC
jgi:hypothetical protein